MGYRVTDPPTLRKRIARWEAKAQRLQGAGRPGGADVIRRSILPGLREELGRRERAHQAALASIRDAAETYAKARAHDQ
jgi:hypothetical protein